MTMLGKSMIWLGSAFALAVVWSAPLAAANAVWWEGESAIRHDFVEAPWIKTEIRRTRLSGMDWLSCFLPRDSAEIKPSYAAEYAVEVASAGQYFLWAREFYRPTASPWRFRLNGGAWIDVDGKHAYEDIADLGRDRSAVWCKYGPFDLAAGPVRMELEVLPQAGRDVIAGFDAFLLIDAPFVPNGWKKPPALSTHEYIGTYVWCEGEDAEHSFVNQDRQLPEESPKLSGGRQLVLARPGAGGSGAFAAKWSFIIPADDSYHVWVRQSDPAQSSPYRHRFNIARWREMPPAATGLDSVDLGRGVSTSWVYHGKFFLIEGENTLELAVDGPSPAGQYRLAVDAVCLSLEPFFPNGRHRPGAVIESGREGWFPFQAQGDIFLTEEPPVLNLRHLNERQAGIRGHCRVNDRAGIVLADGSPARFWGVNAFQVMNMGREEVDYFVARMARSGVNLIRIRGPLGIPGDKVFGTWDKATLDRLHYLVGACRKQGVYVALSPYAPTDYEVDRKQGYLGYDTAADKAPYGLLFINPDFRSTYREWTSFLSVPNPYTKMTLAEDPALAWYEIQHGDSLFSASFGSVPKEQRQIIEDAYNKWLTVRYGSEMHILRSWSIPGRYHPVMPEDGRQGARCFRLLPPEMFQPATIDGADQGHLRRRKTDQIRFLAEIQQGTYAELVAFLRETRGLKCLVAPGAAPLASPGITEAIEHWTHSPGGLIARTGSLTPLLIDAKPGEMSIGLRYRDRSALHNPLASPLMGAIYAGRGNVLTELFWPMPNGYRSEAAALVAAYLSLHGGNGLLWHEAEAPGWAGHLGPRTIQSPAMFGAFPGYALLFRRGDLQMGKPAVDQGLRIEDQFDLRGIGTDYAEELAQPRLAEMLGFQRKTYGKDIFDPALFLAGPILRSFADKAGYLNTVANAAQLHDRRTGVIRSVTGELTLDYRQGLLTIDSPRAQAAVGFIKESGGTQALRDVVIACDNEYANILVNGLDDAPVAESAHLLVQSITREMNLGWEEERTPRSPVIVLKETGEPPILLEELRASVLLRGKRAAEWQAWALNPNGRRIADVALADETNGLRVVLPADALYVELKRR
jgi:hypothetical protein